MCEGLWAVFAPAMPPEPTNRRTSRRSQRYSATSSTVYRQTQVMRKNGTSSQQDEPQDYPMRDATRPESGRILFYDRNEPYYEFTNFSYHPIVYNGKTYPTAEHLFQASKFLDHCPDVAEQIRHLPTPRAALQEATRRQRLRRHDWFDVNLRVMDAVLEAKFTQHPALYKLLLETGDRELIEASPIDSFWGWGENEQGRNELGKALMRLRDRLRRQQRAYVRESAASGGW
ncbi:hypothetical protein BC629DRAFT_1498975 [Irpex lacteus]|nr:hypothetical protein BC629DRAFT_1498975 [Irpex lacteus]